MERVAYNTREQFASELRSIAKNPDRYASPSVRDRRLDSKDISASFGEPLFPFRYFSLKNYADTLKGSIPEIKEIDRESDDNSGLAISVVNCIFQDPNSSKEAVLEVALGPITKYNFLTTRASLVEPYACAPFPNTQLSILIDENGNAQYEYPVFMGSFYPSKVSYGLVRSTAEVPLLGEIHYAKLLTLMDDLLSEQDDLEEGTSAVPLIDLDESTQMEGKIGYNLKFIMSAGESIYRWNPKDVKINFDSNEEILEIYPDSYSVTTPNGSIADNLMNFLLPLDERLYDISVVATFEGEE
jgi:hypothetical protein